MIRLIRKTDRLELVCSADSDVRATLDEGEGAQFTDGRVAWLPRERVDHVGPDALIAVVRPITGTEKLFGANAHPDLGGAKSLIYEAAKKAVVEFRHPSVAGRPVADVLAEMGLKELVALGSAIVALSTADRGPLVGGGSGSPSGPAKSPSTTDSPAPAATSSTAG